VNNPWNLPPRQAEILTLLTTADNGCNKKVAQRLGIDSRTVEEHLRRAYKRMGVTTRMQAALTWDRWARAQQ
jgi:DNA-binding NarL/FixJ family response regulator